MEYKKNEAVTAFSNLQDFSSFCFISKRILDDKDANQITKIEILKKYSSFFITDSFLFAIKTAKILLEKAANYDDSEKSLMYMTSFGVALKLENEIVEFKGMLKSNLYDQITNFEAVASISEHFEANENDFFNVKDTERLDMVCKAIGIYIKSFHSQTALISSLLGGLLLQE